MSGSIVARHRLFPPLLNESNWDHFVAQNALTPREAEVILLLSSGQGYHEICERLNLKRPTLRTHLRSAYQKIGCANRVELILLMVHEYRRPASMPERNDL